MTVSYLKLILGDGKSMQMANPLATPSVSEIYRHYKGNLYQVVGIGRHSETHEMMIVYRGLYNSPEFGNQPLWIRPLDMFFETVIIDGKERLRFELVKTEVSNYT